MKKTSAVSNNKVTKKIAQRNFLGFSMVSTINALTLAAFLCVFSTHAQPTLQWNANYGSNSSDGAQNILPTSDGGYLVVGAVDANTGNVGSSYFGSRDGWVIKLNASGAIVWKKAYGTTGYDNGINQAIEVSDGYVLVGSEYYSGGVSTDKLWYAKVSKTNGSIIWSKKYNSTYKSIGYAITSTPDGGYLVGGYLYENSYKAILLKTNSIGNISTTYTSNPSGGLWGYNITQIEKTPDNGYLLLGTYYDNSEPGCNPTSEVPDPYDVWLCKFSSSYTVLWSKSYGGTTTDNPKDVVVTPSSEIFVLGQTNCNGTVTGPNNIGKGDWLMKANSNGTFQNVIKVSTNLFDYTVTINGIGLSCDNQILMCGQDGGLNGTSAIVKKISTSFTNIWSFYTTASTSIARTGYDIVATSDKGYIMVGNYNSTAKSNDFYIAKLSPDPGCSPACGSPTGLSTSNITQNTATLNWTAVSSALNYTIQFYSNGTWESLGSSTYTGTSRSIYGLYANSMYTWRILANCASGQSAPSASATFNTPTVPNCTVGTQYPTAALNPASNWQYQTQIPGGKYCLVNVLAGETYTFSYCSSDGGSLTYDGEISIKSTGNQVIAYSDDFCGNAPKIVWKAGFSGQVRVLLTDYPCASKSITSKMAYKRGPTFASNDPDALTGTEETPFTIFEPTTDIREENGILEKSGIEARNQTSFDTTLGNGISELSAFPNPVADRLTMRFNNQTGETKASLRVSDAMGRLVLASDFSPAPGINDWEIQTEHWPNGMYIFQLSTLDGKLYNERIQVVK